MEQYITSYPFGNGTGNLVLTFQRSESPYVYVNNSYAVVAFGNV